MPEFPLQMQYNNVVNQEQVMTNLRNLEDGFYTVRIAKSTKRSLAQNKYYWGIMIPMIMEGLVQIGYREIKNHDQVHEMLKAMFLRKKVLNEINGDEMIIHGSTASLTKVEFMEFVDEVVQWAGEYLSIAIPEPNANYSIY